MANITNNYLDTNFGNATIDFSGAQNPFSVIVDQNVFNTGFGSSTKEITTDTSNVYKNNHSLNFGSLKNITVDQVQKKYQYEEIFERGERRIKQDDYVIITIKNKLITNPVFLCTPIASNIASDTSLSVEKINNDTFKVFNTCHNTIDVAYIAVQNNTVISSIPKNVNSINVINKIIKNSLS